MFWFRKVLVRKVAPDADALLVRGRTLLPLFSPVLAPADVTFDPPEF